MKRGQGYSINLLVGFCCVYYYDDQSCLHSDSHVQEENSFENCSLGGDTRLVQITHDFLLFLQHVIPFSPFDRKKAQ